MCIVYATMMDEAQPTPLGDNPLPDRTEAKPRTLRSLASTPWKKALLIIQLISYVLIVGSPLIGGAIGGLLGMKAGGIGSLIFGIFLAGEVLFYGSLAFLGKEVVLLIRAVIRAKFKRRS